MPTIPSAQCPPVFSKFGKRTSGLPRQPGFKWFVLQVRSRQEKCLAREIQALKICYFLPMQEKPMSSGGRVVMGQELLFDGFIFVLGDLADLYRIFEIRPKRLWGAGFITVRDQFRLRADLRRLARVIQQVELTRLEAIRPGTRVRVIAGHALEGLEAKVDLRDRTRVWLDVHLVGAVSFEIDAKYLQVLK